MNSDTFIMFHLGRKVAIIGGTEYAGEMKKGIFSIMHYYLPLKNLPPQLLHICIASAVNMGARQMMKLLQRASGLSGSDVDGYIGPKTIAAAQSTTAGEFREQRYLFYIELCESRPEYEKYKNGWLRRTMRV